MTARRTSLPAKIDQHYVRTLLLPFQDNFTAVWGDVEVPNIEIAREFGQLPLRAGLRVRLPEIFVFDPSPQESESTS